MTPKFRAWHKTWEEMGRIAFIRYKESGEIAHLSFRRNIYNGNIYGGLVKLDEIELMQSTGLRDMNNREIFEGDIVQFEDCYEVSDFLYINTGIIEWCQGGFYVTNRDSVSMEDLLDGDLLEVTIIGNVYENPELLEVNHDTIR